MSRTSEFTAKDKLAAAILAMQGLGYRSAAKRRTPYGEWFQAPTSTKHVEHLIAIDLNRGSRTELEIYCALRNSDSEAFAQLCLKKFGGRDLSTGRFPYATVIGIADPPSCAPLRIALQAPSELELQMLDSLVKRSIVVDVHYDGNTDRTMLEPLDLADKYLEKYKSRRTLSPDQAASEVVRVLMTQFNPSFLELCTLREFFDRLVADEGIWRWWPSNIASRIAQILSLGVRLGVSQLELLSICDQRRQEIQGSLPRHIFADQFCELVLNEALHR